MKTYWAPQNPYLVQFFSSGGHCLSNLKKRRKGKESPIPYRPIECSFLLFLSFTAIFKLCTASNCCCINQCMCFAFCLLLELGKVKVFDGIWILHGNEGEKWLVFLSELLLGDQTEPVDQYCLFVPSSRIMNYGASFYHITSHMILRKVESNLKHLEALFYLNSYDFFLH